jgi:hypothetical protein
VSSLLFLACAGSIEVFYIASDSSLFPVGPSNLVFSEEALSVWPARLLSRFGYSMRGRNRLSLRALPFSSPAPGGSILLYFGLVFPVRCSPSVNMSRASYVLYFTELLVKAHHVGQVASSVYVTLMSPLRIECHSVLSPARSAPSSHTSTATTTISYVRTISHTPGRRWHAFPAWSSSTVKSFQMVLVFHDS